MGADLSPIYLAAATVGVACFLVARLEFSNFLAAAVAVIRIAIPVIYFLYFYDGTWTVIDDVTYAAQGQMLLEMGYTPWSVLSDLEYLRDLSGGEHILFAWWNMLAQTLFGVSYYAPVLMNIVTTFVSGVVMCRILRHIGYTKDYTRGFLLFFLLHWDVLVWSSFLNLKDMLVMMLTVVALYLIFRFMRRLDLVSAGGLVAIAVLFSMLRFYVPVLLLLTTAFWLLLEWRNPRRHAILAVLALALFVFARRYAFALDYMQGERSIVFGVVRYILTPQPWSLDPQYSFLAIPSVLHWLLCIPMFLACKHLWSSSRPARLIILYLMLVTGFYSLVPDLQGPRHRVQIVFIFVWGQFHFLRSIASYFERANVSLKPRPGSTQQLTTQVAMSPVDV